MKGAGLNRGGLNRASIIDFITPKERVLDRALTSGRFEKEDKA